MDKGRPKRSKTGCNTCRRRRVRCDERKPICGACTRLSLECTFERMDASSTSTSMKSKYRIRFVNSPYTKLPPDDHSKDATRTLRDAAAGSADVDLSLRGSDEDIIQVEEAPLQLAGGIPGSVPGTRNLNDFPIQGSSPGPLAHWSSSSSTIHKSLDLHPQLDSDGPQHTIGTVPVFFDLDMNFDLIDSDDVTPLSGKTPSTGVVPPQPTPTTLAVLPVGGSGPGLADRTPDGDPTESSVMVQYDDHELIQHYLNVMSNYTRIRRSGDENLYSQIFSNMALFYAPLYNVIMAWTGLHLGQTKSGLTRKAEQRYNQAVALMYADQKVAQHFELSLVTIWFMLQFELLAAKGVDLFCQHLDYAADLVETYRRYRRAEGKLPSLGAVGARVLVWLGSYDARAAYAGSMGRLLQSLETLCVHYDFIEVAFADVPLEAGAADLKPCLRLVLELDMVESRILQLHLKGGTVPVAIWSSIQADLIAIRGRLECDPATAPAVCAVSNPTRSLGGTLTTKRFNWLLLLASFYSVVVTYHRMLPTSVGYTVSSDLISAEAAAARIIRIALWVNQSRQPSPQNVWSRILFIAGIETTDLVYQDWVAKTLSEAETWGANFHKTRLLLQHVIAKQNREGVKVDFLDVMRQTTGLFII